MNGTRLALVALVSAGSFALAPAPAAATVHIVEFLASNGTGIVDEDGDRVDWMEIANDGPSSVDLLGWHLTDDAAALAKWSFPSVVVPAGGRLVVFASDKDRAVTGQPLHTNFRLASEGEYLALVRDDGTTIEHDYSPRYPPQANDVSWGLASDLVQQRCFFEPTPGAVNDETPPCGNVEEIAFSAARGFYSAPFALTLSSATPGATIRYTVDGSLPTESHGLVYAAPIPIGTTTIVRATAFAAGLTPAAAVAYSYIFLDDVVRQTGAGFPTGSFADDYQMDPRVVDDPRYAPTIRDDLRAIPTLSVSMDVNDLFGQENGIYTHPRAHGIDWERAASAEMILEDGTTAFQVNCGIRVQGRLSREKNRKKSFRLAFKDIYGPSKLDYPLFPDSPVKRFNRLRLRAGHNKSWSYSGMRADYIRDQWVRDTQRDMGQVAPHGIYVHLYLNGLYWGLYNVTEQPEAAFAAAYFGGEEDEWDVLKPGEVPDGNTDAWNAARAIANAGVDTDEEYAALRELVDIENLIDYFLANLHAGTTDWDDSNWYAARRRVPGEGFRFFSWDAEQSMEFFNAMRINVHNTGAPSSLYTGLRSHPEFRLLFADHAHRFLFHDGALTPAACLARFRAREKQIEKAIVGESARWGDAVAKDDPYDRDTDWRRELEWLRLAYFPRRSAVFLSQLRATGLYPTVDAPVLEPFGGHATSFELHATCESIRYTTDGSDPRLAGGAVAPTAMEYGAPVALSGATTVSARCLDHGTWSALERGRFTPEVTLALSELMFHPAAPLLPDTTDRDAFEFLEFVNTGSSPLLLAGLALSDGVDFAFPATTLGPGDRALVVSNVDAFEARYGTGLPVLGTFSGHLANDGERLRVTTADGDPVIDLTWDDAWFSTADGGGRSLVVRNPTSSSPLSEISSWRASAFDGGSPGVVDPLACADGLDNDGDGQADFGADVGCANATQDEEDPACSNGTDDDNDGRTDGSDPHCDSATDDDERSTAIDAFLCRSVSATQGIPASSLISLDNEMESGRTLELAAATTLCRSAVVNDESTTPPMDPDTSLLGFGIRPADGLTSPATVETFATGLGPIWLDTSSLNRLLIPAFVDPGAPVSAPIPGTHAVDAFACYRAKPSPIARRDFPRSIVLLVRTADGQARYRIQKPTGLCVAASIDGQPRYEDGRRMVCYQAMIEKGLIDTPPTTTTWVGASTPPTQVELRRVVELCVPE